jgi:hypothetical protein
VIDEAGEQFPFFRLLDTEQQTAKRQQQQTESDLLTSLLIGQVFDFTKQNAVSLMLGRHFAVFVAQRTVTVSAVERFGEYQVASETHVLREGVGGTGQRFLLKNDFCALSKLINLKLSKMKILN